MVDKCDLVAYNLIIVPNIFKRTPARAKIVEFLYSSGTPVDIQEIIDFLRGKKLGTNKATVYRTMEMLFTNGFVDRVEFGEGKFRYEIKKDDHHHFICQNCARIEDISDCNISVLEEEIKKKKGLLIKKHSLEFFGLCKDCQN